MVTRRLDTRIFQRLIIGIIQMTEISLCIIDACIQQPQFVKTYKKAVNNYELKRSLKSQVTLIG